ncbi:unnamed protein product [Lathyrus sativus]|nr:unnamed protein product [Lathyrus sativus]
MLGAFFITSRLLRAGKYSTSVFVVMSKSKEMLRSYVAKVLSCYGGQVVLWPLQWKELRCGVVLVYSYGAAGYRFCCDGLQLMIRDNDEEGSWYCVWKFYGVMVIEVAQVCGCNRLVCEWKFLSWFVRIAAARMVLCTGFWVVWLEGFGF